MHRRRGGRKGKKIDKKFPGGYNCYMMKGRDSMKKWVPFLWLYPMVGFIVSFFVAGEGFVENYMFGAVMVLLCFVAQVMIPIVYYCTHKHFRNLAIITCPVLFAISMLSNIETLGDKGFGLALLLAVPAACSLMFMMTVRMFERKKEEPVGASAAAPVVMDKPAVSKAPEAQASSAKTIPAEELKKLKELLDMGVITQEEFEIKKKELLGL